MLRRGHKGRQSTASLINLHKFQKIRQEKEKIIKSPFEENWKKTMVMEELLALYSGQERHGRYSRSGYKWGPGTGRWQEDFEWDCNEDKQLSKYYKMADGLSRFEDHYQQQNIRKAIDKIESRSRRLPNTFPRTTTPEQFSSPRLLPSFHKLITRNPHSFEAKRQQIQELQRFASSQYGVLFKTDKPQTVIDPKVEEFKRKDKEIFQKLFQTIPKHPPKPQSTIQTSDDCIEKEERVDRQWLSRSPGREISWEGKKREARKRYIRIE